MITRLRELREKRELSQEDCAKAFKMSLNTYARYERGEREVKLSDAIEIAEYYNVSIDYIANRKKTFVIKIDESENIELLYEKLKETDKELIKSLMKRLVE